MEVSSLCARQDMLGEVEAQAQMRRSVKRLPVKYATFDHSFASLRDDDKYWYLRLKPIRHAQKTPLEERLSLTDMMKRAEPKESIRKEKIKPKDLEVLAELVGRASPIPADLLANNSLDRRTRVRGDLEGLRLAVSAAKGGSFTGVGSVPEQTTSAGGPTGQKNAEERPQSLNKRMPQR